MSASVAMPVAPDALKRAVYARRDHFLANVATLTMKQARRLIETDLGLDAKVLDEEATKAAVAKYVDRVLASGDGPPEKVAAASKENRAPAATKSPAKPQTKDADDDADEEEETDADEEEETDADSEGSDSDASDPPSTKKRKAKKAKRDAKPSKTKRAAPVQITGVVATLRDVCKRAGLTYQHVFMRHKDDDGRIEMLTSILSENGLDADASDKQIAKVRAKVELARDLDGIDKSNVIEGGRRRRAAATNDPWGQAVNYAERKDGEDEDDSESDDRESDDEESDEESGDEDAVSDDAVSDAADAEKVSSDSEVEPADLFFDDDDGDEAPVDAGTANGSKPADVAVPKAPRRGGALYSDSDEE